MSATLKVKYADGEYVLPELRLGGLVRFERHFGVPAAILVSDDKRTIEHVAFLAYLGLIKAGVLQDTAAFDDLFLDALVSVEFVTEDEDVPDPFDQAAPPTS